MKATLGAKLSVEEKRIEEQSKRAADKVAPLISRLCASAQPIY